MAEQAKKEPSVLQTIAISMYRPGEFSAMLRELFKDTQNTFHEVVFGKPGHAPESGTPLNPTPQIITAELLGRPLTPRGPPSQDRHNSQMLDMPAQSGQEAQQQQELPQQAQEPTQQSTLEMMKAFAQERTGAALERMDNAHQHEQSRSQDRGGMEM